MRGGRKSSKRVGGALEPFHTIDVSLEDKGGELGTMKEARVARVRARLVSDLDALDAAGVAMRWARHLWPPRTPEPEAWAVLVDLLDALDDPARGAPRALLARAGLLLLGAVGYGLDLERCVRCGKPCPEGRPSCVDAAHGGLVCRACGGSSRVMDAELRAIGIAVQRGERPATSDVQAKELLAIVDEAMAAHAGFDPNGAR